MPVCITGMHRSGTSLVANLLRRCGLYLGEEDKLLPASPDNTDGYWEHRDFVSLNEDILLALGSAWDRPSPAVMEGWPYEERFNPSRIRAEVLLSKFADHEPWGWKDPRTSLTLPFWLSLDGILIPFWSGRGKKLKVVVCLRDPLEVFRSLRDRTFTPSSAGLDLWQTYNEKILESTSPQDRIITHYDSYFRDAASELARVLNFLRLEVSHETVKETTRVVSSAMRHQNSSIAALREANVSSQVIDLYVAMCEEANHLHPLESLTVAS